MSALANFLDVLLLLLFAARLIRLVIVDDLGQWLIAEPVGRMQERIMARHPGATKLPGKVRFLNAFYCPWCCGFWLCALAVLSLAFAWHVGGILLLMWRAVAGVFALNYVAVHLMGALGDFDEEK